MVVSHEAGNRKDRSLIDVAHQWGIVALVVHSSRVSPGPGSPTERSLAAPYAGYQVVDELADLLAAKRLADHAAAASASIGL